MRIEVKLEGDAELAKALERVAKNFPRERELFLRQEAELLKARVKPKTPADTGLLRQSWESGDVEGDSIEVGNNVEYVPYVEFGHRIVAFGKDTGKVQPGEFMLRDACDELEDNFNTDARRILARLFK